MSHHETMTSYAEAWNAHDADRVAEHFSEGGIRHWMAVNSPMIGGPTRFWGREEIREVVQAFIDALPDLTVEFEVLADTDWGGVAEWRVRGTHTGAWGRWAGQGEDVDLPGMSVYRISDGGIDEERMYFDPDMMARNWAVPMGALMGMGVQTFKQSRAARKALATASAADDAA